MAEVSCRFLPVSDRDEKWGLFVTGVGFGGIAAGDDYPFHGPLRGPHGPAYFTWEKGRVLSEYSILYITSGEGEFESQTAGKARITAGNVLLLFPGEWHRYRPTKKTGWDEHWVNFNGEYAERLTQTGFFSPRNPVLDTGLEDTILRPFLRMQDRVKTRPIGYQQLLAADTMEAMATILAFMRRGRLASRIDDMVQQMQLMLEQHIYQHVDIEQLATSLNISYTRMRHVFREHTGLSPYQYYQQSRVNRAKEMLRADNLPIKQIAATLGFKNPYHFSKVFKKYARLSPTKWRNGELEELRD